MLQEKALIVWLVTDGKKGHEKQLRGILSGLERQTLVTSYWIKQGKMPDKECDKPDFIFCAGHSTHFKALFLRWLFGGTLLVLMKPSLPISWFDGCIIPEHDKPKDSPYVFKSIGPLNELLPGTKDECLPTLVLLGGGSKGFVWDERSLVNTLEKLVLDLNQSVWIVGSRRTPDSTINLLRKTFSSLDVKPFIFSANDLENDWLTSNLPKLSNVWVTQDSANMVYEGLSVGACVGVITLKPKSNGRVVNGSFGLIKRQWVRVFDGESKVLPCDQLNIPVLRESDRAARWILKTFQNH